MKMLQSNMLIKQLTKEQLGTIVLPGCVQDEWCRGEVIGAGPAIDGDIKVGDIVIFPPPPPHLQASGGYPTIGNEGYIVIPEMYLLAIED